MCEDKAAEEQNLEAAAKAKKSGALVENFTYTSDFDDSGILYWTGTLQGSRQWSNPAVSGLVKITSSTLAGDSAPCTAIVGRSSVRCVTEARPNSWFIIDFLKKTVSPTHYSLKYCRLYIFSHCPLHSLELPNVFLNERHYNTGESEALRNWRLSGSPDGKSWEVIKDHHNDTSLKAKGGTQTWKLTGNLKV
jgi:hypothetical protein